MLAPYRGRPAPDTPLSGGRSQPPLVEELHQVALALLVSAQPGQVGGELSTRAQPFVTVPDLDEQVGDLRIDRIAGLRPERLDRTQVDGQGVVWPVDADQVGKGEPLAGAGDPGGRVPGRGDITVVDQCADPHRASAPAELGVAAATVGGGILLQLPHGLLPHRRPSSGLPGRVAQGAVAAQRPVLIEWVRRAARALPNAPLASYRPAR